MEDAFIAPQDVRALSAKIPERRNLRPGILTNPIYLINF